MWCIRRNLDDFDPLEVYGCYPKFISFKIHHGGVFTKCPRRQYINGKVNFVDLIDSDASSVHEINVMMQKLGYDDGSQIMYYYFKIPDCDIDFGLHDLANEDDVLNLLKYVGEYKIFDVYTEVNVPKQSTKSCKQRLMLEWYDTEDRDGLDLDFEDFDPFEGQHFDQVEEENQNNASEDSGDDSDFMAEKQNIQEDVDVDMSHFNSNIDREAEWVGNYDMGPNEANLEGCADVVDFDDFDSDLEGGVDSARLKALYRMRKEHEAKRTDFFVGQTFGNKAEIKVMITMYSIQNRRNVKLVKNDKMTVRAICTGLIPDFDGPHDSGSSSLKSSGTKCPWVLHISLCNNDATWMVKTFVDTHKCLQTRNPIQCTATFLANHLEDSIAPNPTIPLKALQDQVQKKYEIGVSQMKVFRAKTMATNKVRGDYAQQYEWLRDYFLELQRTNPETTIKLEVESEPNPTKLTRQFKRVYICFGALKKGFKASNRELLGLDGTFMKGPFPGQLLTAVGVDPNNGTFPLAYAIVEAECTSSWTWFLDCLVDDLDLNRRSNFTFISDRQKGIIPAIAKIFSCAEHRYCLRHIHENMKLRWKGKTFKDLLWKCATVTTVNEFSNAMDELKVVNKDVYEWLRQISPQHWSRSHMTGRCHCDALLNNICEVFNRQLIDGRDKPIITALEFIREYLMKRIVIVQTVIEKCNGLLTPTATRMLNSIKKEAAQYNVIWNGGDAYQVGGPWNDQRVVDLKEKTCSCRRWELTGIPCKHAVASIWHMAKNGGTVGMVERWVHPCYSLQTWKDVYSFKLQPVVGRDLWPRSDCTITLTPPVHHTQVGRPKKKRKKTAEELHINVIVHFYRFKLLNQCYGSFLRI